MSYFAERISLLESKLKNDQAEFRKKDKLISELEAELEAAKVSNDNQSQIEEISKKALKIFLFYLLYRIKLHCELKLFLKFVSLTSLTFRKLYQQRILSYGI